MTSVIFYGASFAVFFQHQPPLIKEQKDDENKKAHLETGEPFAVGRANIRLEGSLIYGSCGATIAGAYRIIRVNKFGEGKRVDVLFAVSERNYMTHG